MSTSDGDSIYYLNCGLKVAQTRCREAFTYLSIAFALDSNLKESHYFDYITVLETLTQKFCAIGKYVEIYKILDAAKDLFPESSDLLYLLATALQRGGKYREAWQYSYMVFLKCPDDPKALDLYCKLTDYLFDRWHIPMLNDFRRNSAFKSAIECAVKRGHQNVFDIGAGTGLLSIYAKRSGASDVIACEMNDFMYELMCDVVRENGISDITTVCEDSNDMKSEDLKYRPTLVVTETFDAGLLGEHVLLTLNHVWQEFFIESNVRDIDKHKVEIQSSNLNRDHNKTLETYKNKSITCDLPRNEFESSADAQISDDTLNSSNSPVSYDNGLPAFEVVPHSAEVYICVANCDFIAHQIKYIGDEFIDIFTDAKVTAKIQDEYLSEKVSKFKDQVRYITDWVKIEHVTFNSPENIRKLLAGKESVINLTVIEDGRPDCILLAYKLHLDEVTVIDTFPGSETCWENAAYPIYDLELLKKGVSISVLVKCDGIFKIKIINQESSQNPNVLIKNDNISKQTYAIKSPHNYTESSNHYESAINSENGTKDIQLATDIIKFLNSRTICNLYKSAARNFSDNFSNSAKDTTELCIMDLCPFPIGGLELCKLFPKTKLYISNDELFELLKNSVKINHSNNLTHDIHAIFFWPFEAEGNLKQELMDKVQAFREGVSDNLGHWLLFPSYLSLKMAAIDSNEIQDMTIVSDTNTDGVMVASSLQVTKTLHHLDCPLQFSTIKTLASTSAPVFTWNFLSEQNYISSVINECKDIDKKNIMSSSLLFVGHKTKEIEGILEITDDGQLIGFSYWFELGCEINKSSNLNTSCKNYYPMSNITQTKNIGNDLLAVKCKCMTDIGGSYIQGESKSLTCATFGNKNDGEPEFNETKGIVNKIMLLASTLAFDSPINQCILLLCQPMNVSKNETVKYKIYISGEKFSVQALK